MKGVRRGITSIADIKARCKVDLATRCWNWQAAMSGGQIKMHVFDHRVGEKRTLSGPTAIWNVAHDEAPPRWSVVRMTCFNSQCANPAHVRAFQSIKAWGRSVEATGRWKGNNQTTRRENLRAAWKASGIKITPPEVVQAVREAPPTETGIAIAARLGLTKSIVSRIRRGDSFRGVAG